MSKISEKKVTKENAMGNRLEAITKKLEFQYLLDQNCIGKKGVGSQKSTHLAAKCFSL